MYNRLDNRVEDRFLAYADFDANQISDIKDVIDHFHVWHRQSQLDGYAVLLEDVVRKLRSDEALEASDIELWGGTMREYTSTLGSCNPFYTAAENIASLSDEQINEIRTRREEQRRQRRAKREEREDEEEMEIASNRRVPESTNGRVRQLNRYLRLAGFRANKEQLADLSKTMESTVRPKTSFRELRDKLDDEFYSLVDQRNDPNWEAVLVDYLDRRRTAMADRVLEARLHNRGVWEDYALRAMQSFDDDQKQAAINYLSGLASTLKALAKDTPSFQKSKAGEYRCLGKKIS